MITTDKQSLELLIDTAKKSAEVSVKKIPGREDQVLICSDGNHELMTIERIAPDRSHTFCTLRSFLDLYLDQYAKAGGTIWHSNAACVFFLDALRYERATLPLELSPLWKTLGGLVPGKKFPHKEFLRLLKHTLAGAIDPAFVAAFSQLDIATMARINSNRQQQQQSLDKSVQAQISGPEKPTSMTVEGRIFSNSDMPLTGRVAVSIEIDLDEQVIVVQTFPDAYEVSLRIAQQVLSEEIREQIKTDVMLTLTSPVAAGEATAPKIVRVPEHLVLWGTP